MGEQLGTVKISGTFDDLCLYKWKGKFLVRRKSSLTRTRVLNEPGFVRTRENASEFSRSVVAGKLIRRSVWGEMRGLADNELTARMNGIMSKVLKADTVQVRGNRRVQDGNLSLLKEFNFNRDCSLDEAFPVPYDTTINTSTAAMSLFVPGFVARQHVKAPPGATHFRIISCAVALDFENAAYRRDIKEYSFPLLNDGATDMISFQHQMEPVPGQVLMLLTGISFFSNGENGGPVKGGAMAVKQVGRVTM